MIAPPNRKDKVPLGLDGKHQQQRNEERENPQSFCKCDTDEHCGGLACSCRRVAQCARQKVADHMAHTDGGAALSGSCQACTDICAHLYYVAFHVESPYDWFLVDY